MVACGHNLLKAHAQAVRVFRSKYQRAQGGKIGFTTNIVWAEPMTDSAAGDLLASAVLPLLPCLWRAHLPVCGERAPREAYAHWCSQTGGLHKTSWTLRLAGFWTRCLRVRDGSDL